MGTCNSTNVKKDFYEHKPKRYDNFARSQVANLSTSCYRRPSPLVEYKKLQKDKVQRSRKHLPEPKEYLDKLFVICACKLNAQMTSISEANNIFSKLYQRSVLDGEDYFQWKNENSETALEIAIKAGNRIIVGLFLEKGDESI